MVSGDAYVRVRRQRRSSAGPCADRRRPGQRCSTWDDIAREADKFPPIVRGDQPFAQSVIRSEEHTSELQSLMRISYAVFCLKKKKIDHDTYINLTTIQLILHYITTNRLH